MDSLSGPGGLLHRLLESTRAACLHTCLRAREAWGQGRREGGAQECLLFLSQGCLCRRQRSGAKGRLGQWGAPESKLRAPGGAGRAGSELRSSKPRPPGWDSDVCFTAPRCKTVLQALGVRAEKVPALGEPQPTNERY